MASRILKLLPVISALVLIGLGVAGYRLSQSWGQLGQTFDGIDAAGPERTTSQSARGADGSPTIQAAPAATSGAAPNNPSALADEIDALKQELARELVDDPELLASLDEMFDEPDEATLRENIELLREAFLSEIPE